MNKQKYVLGTLLKAERLKQNKSQKEICFGICVNSYLSKIEHGIVKPDVEIMQKLYLRLNITITTDITLLNYFKDKIKEFYHAILYYLNTDIIYNDLMDYDQSLQFSEFCIDWLIIKTYHNIDCYQQLNALESCMLPKQKAYYYVISE